MRSFVIASCALVFACASAPTPAQDEATLWGYVKLDPKRGASVSEDSYADRRLRNAPRFDYSHPVFAVVYAAAPPPPPSVRSLSIESVGGELAFRPARLAIGRADSLRIDNHSAQRQIVSAPTADWVGEVAAGESITLAPNRDGEIEVYLLGGSRSPALVWVASGPFTVADSAGRYELRGLHPGLIDVRAWHPRLPPSEAHAVRLETGRVVRLDLEIGVDRDGEAHP